MPPSLEVRSSQPTHLRKVTVNLTDVNAEDTFPDRIVVLEAPSWCAVIGRANSGGDGPEPRPDNAWFTSKVVSRQHATLRADPVTQLLTLEDNNSLHGTFIYGGRVRNEPVEVLNGDVVTLGAEVLRHAETYTPLRTRITYEWNEIPPESTQPNIYKNTFTADFSDQDVVSDIDGDDDLEFIRESVRQPSVEIVEQSLPKHVVSTPLTATTPDSAKNLPSSSAPTTSYSWSDASTNKEDQSSQQERVYEEEQEEFDEEDEIDYDAWSIAEHHVPDAEESDGEDRSVDTNSEDEILETNHLGTPVMSDTAGLPAAEAQQREPSPSDAAMPVFHASKPVQLPSVSLAVPKPSTLLQQNVRQPLSSACEHKYTHMSDLSNWQSPYSPQPGSYTTPMQFGYVFSEPQSFAPALPKLPTWTNQYYAAPLAKEACLDSSSSTLPLCSSAVSLKRKAYEMENTPVVASGSSKESYDVLEPICEQDEVNLAHSSVAALEAPKSNETPEMANTFKTHEPVATTLDTSVPEVPIEPPKKASLGLSSDNQTIEVSRPAKRARLHQSKTKKENSSVRTFAKYAATASAGAVVGAVGVIFGLAALPSDYFV